LNVVHYVLYEIEALKYKDEYQKKIVRTKLLSYDMSIWHII